jgi:magnesium transporter
VPSQGSSWFPLPRRIPVRRGAGRNGATTVQAPQEPPLSEEEIRSAVVDCGLYEGGERLGGRIELESALRKADACQHGFVWIGLHDPSPGVVGAVGEHFELHPLAVEDALDAHQRAKLEVYGGDTLFVVLKTARYVDHDELIEIGEVVVFLGERFVVTVRHGEGSPLHDVRLDLEAHPDLLGIGPSSVLYAIADRVVDDYLAVIDGIAVDVEEVEVEVFSGASSNPAERIYRLKREVLEFRRAVTPLIAPMQRLSSRQAGLPLDPRTEEYFRDIHDHLLRDAERITSFDELLTNALQANVAQITMRDNQDMRRISAWVAIIAVPTMVFGLYGMNFEHMPELKWTYGYPLVVAVVLVICAALYRKFKDTGWL